MIFALLACGFAFAPFNDVVQFSVDPTATDPQITALDSDHTIFIDPNIKPTRGLLVFLPGTNGVTTNTKAFCSTAAEDGYQVINLMYPDSIAATAVKSSPDENAFANFRWEIIEGRDLSPAINVNRANSIENRLTKVLKYLNKTRPQEGWGNYLKNGDIDWPDVTMSGLSQGAGHAVIIATKHLVKRVIAFGGPKDFHQSSNKPAAWYVPCVTPPGRIYTFNHKQDKQGCDYDEELQIVKVLGLDKFGGPVDVDVAKPPFHDSRILVTDYPVKPMTSVRAHVSVVGDGLTPRTATGDLLFKPVWHYMLTNGSS